MNMSKKVAIAACLVFTAIQHTNIHNASLLVQKKESKAKKRRNRKKKLEQTQRQNRDEESKINAAKPASTPNRLHTILSDQGVSVKLRIEDLLKNLNAESVARAYKITIPLPASDKDILHRYIYHHGLAKLFPRPPLKEVRWAKLFKKLIAQKKSELANQMLESFAYKLDVHIMLHQYLTQTLIQDALRQDLSLSNIIALYDEAEEFRDKFPDAIDELAEVLDTIYEFGINKYFQTRPNPNKRRMQFITLFQEIRAYRDKFDLGGQETIKDILLLYTDAETNEVDPLIQSAYDLSSVD